MESSIVRSCRGLALRHLSAGLARHYSLTATATHTVGLSGTANPVEIDVIGQGGSLSIEEVAPSSPIDLENQGSADWVLWGPLNTGDSIVDNPGHLLARKSGVAPLISEYKPIGNHPITASAFAHDLCFTSNQQNYCGSDIAVHDSGNGFELNVSADATPRTLQLYVGTQSADGKIIAFLSDGSAPVATEIGGSGGGTPNPGNTTLYNIQFAAASPGQTLTVRFTVNSDQGGGQIALLGATLNGSPIAPSVPAPQITSVTPGSAPLDARITINGTNFGANQGAGYVQIGEQAQMVSWSDTAIVAVVPAALQVGSTADVTVFTDHGVSNAASLNILSYNVFPASINLLAGQSRTLAARDNSGNPVTGLPWSTSDPTILSLSTDDPPVITALAPGSAKVWAGDISVPVTVYAGTVLPAGTPIWTLPLSGGGSGNLNLVPAVPSGSGVDIFALDASGTLTAVSSDGTPVWKVSGIPGGTAAKIIPDFAGSALLQSPKSFSDAQGNFHSTHVVTKVDPNTRQLTDLYTFSDRQSGTLGFSDSFARQTVIPHPSGPVFIQDNATVNVIDPSTGQSLANITLDKFRFNSQESREAVTSHMIVAGDGNAYLPYVYGVTDLNSTGPTSLDTSTHTVTHLMVLRVSPDGTSAKAELRTWTSDSNCTADPASGPSDYHCVNSGLDAPDISDDPSIDFFSPITNAGSGAAVFASVGSLVCANVTVVSGQIHQSGCPDFNHVHTLLTYVSQDAVSSQVEQALVLDNTTGAAQRFTPALQREDGSYIGTDATNNLIAVGAAGGALWTQKFNPDANGIGMRVTPLYTTTDGGTVITSTKILSDGSKQLGSLFTVDQNGSQSSQSQDSGALPSWMASWYNGGPLESIALPYLTTAASFGAIAGGNPSGNGVADRSVMFDIREKIGTVAKSKLGSQNWLDSAGNNKCNIFVHDIIKEAGQTPPESDKTSASHRIGYYLGQVDSKNYPAQAADWANVNKTLGCWKTLIIPKYPPDFVGPVPLFPPDISGAGDVIAEAIQYSDATGHVGIVVDSRQTASADSAVNCYNPTHPPAGTITITDYGFRPDNYLDPTGCRKHGIERHAVVKQFSCW